MPNILPPCPTLAGATGILSASGLGRWCQNFRKIWCQNFRNPQLAHGKPDAPRLDVLSERARVAPDDLPQRRAKIGGNAGYIYADEPDIAARVQGNAALMKRLRSLRDEYIRLDPQAVTFFFAGTELEYSSLIRSHGDYFRMLNDLMDDLADIADAVPAVR